MKILHYSLGFPPYRSGGLTKFCIDLMKEQVKEGHKVALIWPGEMKLFSSKTKIQRDKDVDGIKSFEVINPTPVSYDEGIVDIKPFMNEGDKKEYTEFLHKLKPDVLHIHSFMGIHKNLLVAAKEQGVRLVFTTHDFFPICPKVTLFRNDTVCEDRDCVHCPSCNATALSLKKIRVLQSPIYRKIKDNSVVCKLRKRHRDEYLEGTSKTTTLENLKMTPEKYKSLRNYYKSMYDLMDFIHYNSSITECVYNQYFGKHYGDIISITHSDIQDRRRKKHFDPHIRMTYLGNQGGSKGFFRLRGVLDELWKVRQDFELNVYFHENKMSPYIISHDRYSYDQLESIMDGTDVVIAPSILYETFGYTVLEALSYGVPVIVSDHVGAVDVIPHGGGIEYTSSGQLLEILKGITPESLKHMNDIILADMKIKQESDMCLEIIDYGYKK